MSSGQKCCPECGGLFISESSLRSHRRRVHDVVKKTLCCPADGCNEKSTKIANLVDHLKAHHMFIPQYVNDIFNSDGSFQVWKKEMESFSSVKFICGSGLHKTNSSNRTVRLYCRYSGKPRRKRNTQIQPIRMRESVKIGATCPAYINVHYNEDGTVAVTSQVNHFGHEFEPFYFLQPNPIIDKIVEIIETSSFNREITLQKNHMLQVEEANDKNASELCVECGQIFGKKLIAENENQGFEKNKCKKFNFQSHIREAFDYHMKEVQDGLENLANDG
ncbi:unnamed protein product [Dracunculus medinensis]|uniref:C2H2-type domain-containing protein n=1 Tax=Dracunculus medinensis TaxID=318479 RepID=A0A0N4UJL5_DRAME|nr:unnamed protein product [Dracunculus medinensis]